MTSRPHARRSARGRTTNCSLPPPGSTRCGPWKAGGVDPHATAAVHAVRFAATILWPEVPNTSPPGFRHDSERLLQFAAHCREAAPDIGEFAPPPPVLRLVSDTAPPS